jgi:hypothetical protein
MLDFLGLTLEVRVVKNRPGASGCPSEHANLDARADAVKCLFVNRSRSRIPS